MLEDTYNDAGINDESVDTSLSAAPTYPISEDEHLGVNTQNGASPQSMDQADEEYDAKIWGTPDSMPSTEGILQQDEDTESNHGTKIL